MRTFRPRLFLRGGHLQTLLGYWSRRRLRWTLPAEEVVVDAPGGVRLLLRASWQEDRAARPTLVLVHGLGGDDRSTYSIATGRMAWDRGWNVVRMNMRGAGDSEALCARLYHAGVDTDVLAVLGAVAERTPRLALVGFSLGANLVLLTLGRQAALLPRGLFAAAAVSPPLDLSASADALGRGGGRVYEHERGPRLTLPLPARPQQQAHAAVEVHDQVLDGERPSEVAAGPVAEEGLEMAAPQEGKGTELLHTRSTILPKCSDASIISCARRASARGSTAWTTLRSRPAKKRAAASSRSALLPM